MEGFKQQKKIACFKEGGQVGYKSRKEHSESKEMAEDIKQDKKIVKKAFSIHDKQQHEEKTDLSKLKKGGRAKKEKGTVRKYATGGGVTPEQSSAYKDRLASDIDTSKKIVAGELPAQATPGKLTSAERRASIAKAFGPKLKCGGGMVKKAEGGIINTIKDIGTRLKENVMGTDKQNAEAQARLDKYEASKKAAAPSAPVAKKRGGKC